MPGEVLARVDAPVLLDEGLERGPVLDVGVVQHRVEHDDGEAEDVARVALVEQPRVLLAVPRRERLHDPVDLLRLAGQPEVGIDARQVTIQLGDVQGVPDDSSLW